MGAAGRERARAFSWERSAATLEAVYDEVLAGRVTGPAASTSCVTAGRRATASATSAGATSRSTRSAARRRARSPTQLAGEPIDVVYSSPLRRALDTARPLAAAHAAPLHASATGCKEIDYGAYQDVLKAERKLQAASATTASSGCPAARACATSSTASRSSARRSTPSCAAGRNVAVVAHFWSLRMLAGQVDGLSFDEVLDARRLLAREWCGYLPFRCGRRGETVLMQ